jgi:hypothetical protein
VPSFVHHRPALGKEAVACRSNADNILDIDESPVRILYACHRDLTYFIVPFRVWHGELQHCVCCLNDGMFAHIVCLSDRTVHLFMYELVESIPPYVSVVAAERYLLHCD